MWYLEILTTTHLTRSSTASWEHVPTHWPEPARTTQVGTGLDIVCDITDFSFIIATTNYSSVHKIVFYH